MNPAAATGLDLRDIHAAANPALWPPAPGWWVLAALLLGVLLLAGIWLFRSLRARRQRLQILRELDALSDCYSIDRMAEYVTSLSTLMRRVALEHFSRERVASLTGSDWLRFLDETGGGGEFEHGIGRILESGPYQPQTSGIPAEALLALTRRWVTRNMAVAR